MSNRCSLAVKVTAIPENLCLKISADSKTGEGVSSMFSKHILIHVFTTLEQFTGIELFGISRDIWPITAKRIKENM
jgi:hypothetical protein